ncbi:hypothetical protein [Streptomyces sp. NPDC005486]|uniref:hypothetical protein n=1 Tax=Streptomyces sp. NPDC005486 TaxID=3155345 RepID=UPI0033B1A4C1
MVTLVAVIIAKVPQSELYARLAGLYSYAFLVLMVLIALAIGVYLLQDRQSGRRSVPRSSRSSLVPCWALLLSSRRRTSLS